ncbi:hypothetical protein [Nocardioides massiliensis]|uniref:DUF222 domain-containing protein n=1 Tax=Nocardioides massiliensis TaxID=1325935 RepID=A0ABT9NRH8_9ACTN|nr:hypothetical protein [Nocardioides massiliensis]MDP9822779.1 hypothetical protein [Nocardioides massiliensis]
MKPIRELLSQVEVATELLSQAADEYRQGVSKLRRDPHVSAQGRTAHRQELRQTIRGKVEELAPTASQALVDAATAVEEEMRRLSRAREVSDAVLRVSLALEASHPGDIIGALAEDRDIDGLLAVRQVLPSVADRFASRPGDRLPFIEQHREAVDHALAGVAREGSPAATALGLKAAVRDASERYVSAVRYATQPDESGALSVALSDAMVAG